MNLKTIACVVLSVFALFSLAGCIVAGMKGKEGLGIGLGIMAFVSAMVMIAVASTS